MDLMHMLYTRYLRNRVLSFTAPALKFPGDERGTVAMIFGLMLTLVLGVVGGAVDYGRWLQAHSQTQEALDAAVLAGGRTLQTTSGDATAAIATARSYYSELRSNLTSRDSIDFVAGGSNTTIGATGNAFIATPFLSVMGIPELQVLYSSASAQSEASIATGANSGTSLEVALILDVTGSMCSGGLQPCLAAPSSHRSSRQRRISSTSSYGTIKAPTHRAFR